MKTNRRFNLLIMLIFASACTLTAQTRKEKKEMKEKAVKEIIESENYKIDVATAYPRRGRMVTLSSPYSLEIRNDSVYSYLPYFGRAYSIPYGGGQGLMFKVPIEKYEMEYGKRGVARANLTARSIDDRVKFGITIYPNGSAHIDVTMQQRESINFSGDLYIPDKD
ncbi:DUF4251 domain-containing protein [Bacteroides sp.]